MEKISIARRRQEQRAPLFPISNDYTDYLEPAPQACAPSTGLPDKNLPLSLLEFLIAEVNQPEKGKRKFAVEISSGLERPVKMAVLIQPLKDWPRREFFTVKEASSILRLSEKTLYRQLHQGNLSGVKIGRQWRVILSPTG
ncbi:MAG: helix-turn-helix domain-containing protein [bacterium]|nr:helix-turn-helix domain-containing protein [bacterium]